MAALEKRIFDLEAQTASTDKCVKVVFCNMGEEPAYARARAGISPDFSGKVVCVEFVDAPNELKEAQHDKE
jgi:hypothetical protein